MADPLAKPTFSTHDCWIKVACLLQKVICLEIALFKSYKHREKSRKFVVSPDEILGQISQNSILQQTLDCLPEKAGVAVNGGAVCAVHLDR